MNEKVDLTIIIVSWNVKDLLKSCLESIVASQGALRLEVFIVDNASSDGTVGEIEKYTLRQAQGGENREIKRTAFQIIKNKENLGFAKANNQAIRKANGEFILLLNPDMKLFPDTLTNMVSWMRQNHQAKVAGCHLIDAQGRTLHHVRRFPKLSDQLAIILKLPHLFPNILNKYLRKDFDYSKAQKVETVRGSFFMIRPIPVGGQTFARLQELDERYFLWFEEIDFCCQVKQNGGEVWYTPAAKAIDYVNQSFKQLPLGKTQKYFMSSQLKYFKKWYPKSQYYLLKLAWPIGLAIIWLGEKFNLKSKTKT